MSNLVRVYSNGDYSTTQLRLQRVQGLVDHRVITRIITLKHGGNSINETGSDLGQATVDGHQHSQLVEVIIAIANRQYGPCFISSLAEIVSVLRQRRDGGVNWRQCVRCAHHMHEFRNTVDDALHGFDELLEHFLLRSVTSGGDLLRQPLNIETTIICYGGNVLQTADDGLKRCGTLQLRDLRNGILELSENDIGLGSNIGVSERLQQWDQINIIRGRLRGRNLRGKS